MKWSKPARKPAGRTGRHSRMIWTWPWNTVTLDTLGNSRDFWHTQDCAIGQATAHPSNSRDGASRDGCLYEEGLWCGPDDECKQHSRPRPTVPMWLNGGDCCNDPSSSKTSPSTCKIPCQAGLHPTRFMRCAWMVLRRQSRSSGVVAPRCLHVWLGAGRHCECAPRERCTC